MMIVLMVGLFCYDDDVNNDAHVGYGVIFSNDDGLSFVGCCCHFCVGDCDDHDDDDDDILRDISLELSMALTCLIISWN